MNIKLIMGPDRAEKNITADEGSSIEDVAICAREEYPEAYPYDILISKHNGRYAQLDEKLTQGDSLELFDMRNHAADLAYQRGLCAVYLMAITDVFEAKGVSGLSASIETSLNQGLFTLITAEEQASEEAKAIAMRGLSDDEIQTISKRMGEIVRQNLPLSHDRTPILGFMVPSTGYLRYFELRKYKEGILLRFPKYERPEVMPDYVDDFRMYEAYKEEEDWLALLGTPYLEDMNRVIASPEVKEMILLSEALHEKKIAAIADEIKSKGRRIILIAGPSSSGKTTFARRLCVQLRVVGLRPLYMGTDDYFINREDMPVDEKGEKNYEGLEAVDVDLFCSDMNDLLAGKEVDLPEFDFMDGVKIFGRRITKIDSSQPIVIEGIHALNGGLTRAIDDSEKFRIYISPLTQMNIDPYNSVHTTDARMLRRMVRDYKYRGKSAALTIQEWPKVRAGENVNIFPYNSEADVLFNSNLPYEAGYLARYALPLLEEIGPEDPGFSEAERMKCVLEYFNTIENDDYVPNNSIVREFIGGSVFEE